MKAFINLKYNQKLKINLSYFYFKNINKKQNYIKFEMGVRPFTTLA